MEPDAESRADVLAAVIPFDPALVSVCGGVKEAILYCYLLPRWDASHGVVTMTQEHIQAATGLTRREQETARLHLEQSELIIERQVRNGVEIKNPRVTLSLLENETLYALKETQVKHRGGSKGGEHKDGGFVHPERTDVVGVCNLLADLITGLGMSRPRITESWETNARRLIDRDGVGRAEVERVMRWAMNDVFWQSVIINMTKFYKHFEQLRLAANSRDNGHAKKARTEHGVQAAMKVTEGSAQYSADAESYIVGAMLWNRNAIAEATHVLKGDEFFDPRNALVFNAARDLFVGGAHVDAITVADKLTRDGLLDVAGGKLHIAGLLDDAAGATTVTEHIAIVVRKKHGRDLAQLLAKEPNALTDNELDVVTRNAEQLLYRMKNPSKTEDTPLIGDGMSALMQDLEDRAQSGVLSGIATGIEQFDKKTGGLRGGQLVIVGGRPGMGKTAFMIQTALQAARVEKKVALFSLEMSRTEVRHRALSQMGGVDLWKFGSAALLEDDWVRATRAMADLQSCFITINDESSVTPKDIEYEAHRIAARNDGLDLIVIDYLQLMRSDRRINNRVEEVSDISRSLKVLARKMDVPVLVGSQLSRAVEHRDDKTPVLADLRESGSLEQDADLVVFLFRPEMYAPHDPELDGNARLLLAKHRNGPTGDVNLKFIKQVATFIQYE